MGSRDWHDTGFVFTTAIRTPIDRRNLHDHYKQLLGKAQLPPLKFHSLRHLCATILFTQGVAPCTVMEILGHSAIGLTVNTYSHVIPAVMEDAAGRMQAALRGAK